VPGSPIDLRDVLARHAAGVEGPHRQLCAGLPDRLRRDDAHRLAQRDELSGCQVAAVAHPADAVTGCAGERRAHADSIQAEGVDSLDRRLVDLFVAGDD